MSECWSKEVFAKNLKRYMEAFGKNQKEIAAIIGVSAPTINGWLQAKKHPRIDRIESLAQYFGIKKIDKETFDKIVAIDNKRKEEWAPEKQRDKNHRLAA